MNPGTTLNEKADLDPIEEIRLRTWARVNYTPAAERQDSWHPVILDEMTQKDREQSLDVTAVSL